MHRVLYVTSPTDPLVEQVKQAAAGKLDLTIVAGDAVPQSLDGFSALLIGDDHLAAPLASISSGDAYGPKFVQLTRGHHRDVDAAALSESGVAVAGASPVLAAPVADHCTRQILHLSSTNDFRGLTVGVVGFGRIGSVMADACASAGATVLYSDIRTAMHGSATAFRRSTLDMLLSTCDVVSLHVQWDATASNPLIRERELRLMGTDSILANTADARLVDNAALANALSKGKIGGALLDIEQPDAAQFDGIPNAAITPYTAVRNPQNDSAVAAYAVENLSTALSCGVPTGIVETIGLPRAGDPAFWASKMYPRSASQAR
jgi:phosphoglycerate dehydrogenase-like enzyme